MTCVVVKQAFETFGWNLIGGNKVGIYVKAVDNWSPVEKANISVGWKVLQVNYLRSLARSHDSTTSSPTAAP